MRNTVVLRMDSSSSTIEIRFFVTFQLRPENKSIPRRTKNLLHVGTFGVPKRSMRINFSLSEALGRALQLLDHSYQVDKRVRVHFLQRPAALNFHGTLGSSKLIGNLLIEHARDNHGNHVAFARSQRVETSLESD